MIYIHVWTSLETSRHFRSFCIQGLRIIYTCVYVYICFVFAHSKSCNNEQIFFSFSWQHFLGIPHGAYCRIHPSFAFCNVITCINYLMTTLKIHSKHFHAATFYIFFFRSLFLGVLSNEIVSEFVYLTNTLPPNGIGEKPVHCCTNFLSASAPFAPSLLFIAVWRNSSKIEW